MSALYKTKKSRDGWKGKAIDRGKQLSYKSKELRRVKNERDRYKIELKKFKNQFDAQTKNRQQPVVFNKKDVIFLTLQLFISVRISFRAVNRVLSVVSQFLGIMKVPSVQTIINWVNRLSIARVRNPLFREQILSDKFSNGYIWMIDTTIGLGTGRILALLALDARHYAFNQKAPNLKQVHCVAVSVAASWTGETIAAFLQKVIKVVGKPLAYIKDGGKDLAKSSRILLSQAIGSACISDISHIIANLLKHEYEKDPMFDTFISSIGKVSKKFKQSILACLVPPKVNTRSRFMNLHHLVRWADKVLKHSPRGRASKNTILSQLRESLDRMPQCKNFIKRFLRDANALLECQRILKNKGLCWETYQECQPFIDKIPSRSPVRIGFIEWIKAQMVVAKEINLQNVGMAVTSDSIESLFGVAKKHGTAEVKDANRIALRIPSLCGELTKDDVEKVLSISTKEQREAEDQLFSLIKQRRKILPNPGSLEKINSVEADFVELIPRPKNQSKIENNSEITTYYTNKSGPEYFYKRIEGVPLGA